MIRLSLFAAALVLSAAPVLAADEITECDKLAAHGSDPDRIAPGVSEKDMDFEAAQKACGVAILADMTNPRLQYQLGRAYFYDGKFDAAMPHLEYAAEAGYQQAQFVLGYIIDNGYGGVAKDPCRVEDLWFKSAQQGRMASRVSYPHHVVRDMFKGCKQQASTADMDVYLAGAKDQASGYYQRMLVSMVTEEFAAYKAKH
ncbi:MAG: sel1 repeat family protein [Rhodobacteraceae bacterium]|nr:sel1 repeat family protein [Paracoccaceae bacterium]